MRVDVKLLRVAMRENVAARSWTLKLLLDGPTPCGKVLQGLRAERKDEGTLAAANGKRASQHITRVTS